MKNWKLAACFMSLVPLAVKAEAPSNGAPDGGAPNAVAAANDSAAGGGGGPGGAATAPAPAEPAASDSRSMQDNGFRRGWWGGQFRPSEPWSPMDWDEASIFMKEHSPERFRVIDSLPDGRPRKNRLIGFAVVAYRNLQRIQKDDLELSQIIIRRMELEDSAFGLSNQFRDARNSNDTARQDSIRQLILQKATELVDINLKERQRRIARLEKTLKQQQDQFAADEKNRNLMITRRMRNIIDGPAGPEEEATTQPASGGGPVGSAQP